MFYSSPWLSVPSVVKLLRQRSANQLVKMVPADLSAHAESACGVRPTRQSALHIFADADIFLLHLLRDRKALLDVSGFGSFREPEVEHHPAAFRAQRQHRLVSITPA